MMMKDFEMTENQLAIFKQWAKTNPRVARLLEKLGPESTIKVLKVVRNLRRAANKPKTSI